MAKKKAKQAQKQVAEPKSLLKMWHERTAQIADTDGQSLNAADVSRVIRVSMLALADMAKRKETTDLEAVELLVSEFRDCRERS